MIADQIEERREKEGRLEMQQQTTSAVAAAGSSSSAALSSTVGLPSTPVSSSVVSSTPVASSTKYGGHHPPAFSSKSKSRTMSNVVSNDDDDDDEDDEDDGHYHHNRNWKGSESIDSDEEDPRSYDEDEDDYSDSNNNSGFRPFSSEYCLSSGPVWLAFALLFYTYYAVCYLVCIKRLMGFSDGDISNGPTTNVPLGGFLLVLFNIIFVLNVISYLRCILTDPGTIPRSFQKSENARIERESVEAKTTNGAKRYCQKCSKFKPDRCHHCSLCRRCILKMDHHCPWVNNCVGFGNYKFFQLLLIYTVLLSGLVSCCNIIAIKTFDFKNLATEDVLILIDEGVAILIFLGIVFFCGVHIRFAIENVTTIETYEKRRHVEQRMKALGRETEYTYINPYDVGGYANWKQVFGENPLIWFLPIQSSQGTGCHFPIREDYDRDSEVAALNSRV